MAPDLAYKLKEIEPKVSVSLWPGFEHYKGYGVMSLPFSSGYVLGLRVFPENDFAPYSSVWIQNPDGEWSIFNDGPSLKTSCPRLWGPSLRHTDLTSMSINWLDKNIIEIEMEKPRLVWSMTIRSTPLLKVLNAMNSGLPLWTWSNNTMRRVREKMACSLLKMGKIRFAFETPNHQIVYIMPEETFFISSSKALLEGVDLGTPIQLKHNPMIGGVSLPRRPNLIIGQAHASINDPDEYQQTKEYIKKQ
ncbi:MAG: hypothetical protein GVY19_08745 [Bacteroidetes bacterium]|jgi:hypothetical protein|nr:hypothetical protein [Bacteroidota bacterium]